jgi:hypothetical protein
MKADAGMVLWWCLGRVGHNSVAIYCMSILWWGMYLGWSVIGLSWQPLNNCMTFIVQRYQPAVYWYYGNSYKTYSVIQAKLLFKKLIFCRVLVISSSPTLHVTYNNFATCVK